MGFSLLGNAVITESFTEALRTGALSHGYLFSGPQGAGKSTFARELAAAAVCTGGGFPCRNCSQCKKALHGIHPDIKIFSPPEAGKTIPVEIVREQVCADAAIRPNEGRKKVYLFTHAQFLTPQVQNTLLLTLEEPPSYVLFLVLCENPNALLPTVRSRLSEFHFLPVPAGQALPYLRDRFPTADSEAIQQAYTLSEGFLGQAIEALQQSSGHSEQDRFLAPLCSALCQKNELALLECCVSLEGFKRPEFAAFSQRLCFLLRDAAAAKCGQTALSAFPQLRDALSSSLTLHQLLALYELVNSLREDNEGYVSVPHLCGALCGRGSLILHP